MKGYHICYHTDEDGLVSAAVIYEYLKQVNKDNKNNVRYFFYKVDYTMDLKSVLNSKIPSGDEIYFVDYSFSNENNLNYVLELSKLGIKVFWIDHHKTSYDYVNNTHNKYFKLPEYDNFKYFINTHYCGAYLSYVFAYLRLHTGYRIDIYNSIVWPNYIPLYIRYVDSWDTWKHDLPNTTEFNIGVRAEKRTPSNVFSNIFNCNSSILNKLFSDDFNNQRIIEPYMKVYVDIAIEKGKIIKGFQDIENESACDDYGFEFNIVYNGRIYSCFAVNKRGNSTMFGDRINHHDLVIPFQFNGEMYKYSLFTAKDDVNCEELAKIFGTINNLGGGGHAKAAGFQSYKLIFESNCTVHISNKIFSNTKYNIVTVAQNI